ncbi:hypothetical protein SLA2020_338650 [Shorea laevis]
MLQENSDDNHSFTSDKENGSRGVPWKDFSKYGFNVGKAVSSRSGMPEENISINQADNMSLFAKANRSPRYVLDEALGHEDDDEELISHQDQGYLEKLKISKATIHYSVEEEDDEEGGSRKQRKISRVLTSNVDGRYDVNMEGHLSSRSSKEGKKS